MMLYPSGKLAVSLNSTTTNLSFATTATPATDTSWHHYAVVRSGSTVSVYIDGGSADPTTGTLSGLLSATAACPIVAGNTYAGVNAADFSGLMSQIHLYNVALSQANIATIRTAPGTYTTGLIGYWGLATSNASQPDDSATNSDMAVTGATFSATEPGVPPLAPTALSGVAGDAQVVLNWTVSTTSSPAVTEQHIYRRLSSGSYSTSLHTVTGNVTATYTDTTPTNGSTYFYMIRAYDGTSESSNSTETAAMSPVSGTSLPAAPTALAATPGNSQITLNWTLASPTTGIVSQRVYRSLTPGAYTTALPAATALSSSATSFVDSTASNGTLFYYVVRSFSTVESLNSNQVSSTATSVTLPAAPTNFVATPGDNLVSLFWSRSISTGITQQRIYRTSIQGDYSAPSALLMTIMDNVTQIATDNTAVNGTNYYYVIRSFNGVVESVNSNEQGTIVPSVDAPPLPPTNLTGVSGSGSIFLTWTPSTTPGVTQQLVYRSLASGVYGSPLAIISDGVTSVYTDTSAANGVSYYFVVRAAY
jgi:fibronectin type 3 domain-containing protein